MTQPLDVVERLARVTTAHDLEALVACFSPDYELETPAHPSRAFRGQEQVRRNWEQIFGFVPDIKTEILRSAVTGSWVWSEWLMSGTRRDGSPHRMAGVIIFEVEDSLIQRGRFFLEPVDTSDTNMDSAVREQVAR